MTEETRQSIGFLKLDDGPIQLDYDEGIQLEQCDYGVDVVHDVPVMVRATESLSHVYDLKGLLWYLTVITARAIESERIPGELVLHYELVQLYMDGKIVCKVYKRRSRGMNEELFTSRIESQNDKHTVISIFNRSGLAGELTILTEDVDEFIRRILGTTVVSSVDVDTVEKGAKVTGIKIGRLG